MIFDLFENNLRRALWPSVNNLVSAQEKEMKIRLRLSFDNNKRSMKWMKNALACRLMDDGRMKL